MHILLLVQVVYIVEASSEGEILTFLFVSGSYEFAEELLSRADAILPVVVCGNGKDIL
jgi:hypothetical protein